jgi:hypothetical protein
MANMVGNGWLDNQERTPNIAPAASWFETRGVAALLAMRVLGPYPEERPLGRVSKDVSTTQENMKSQPQIIAITRYWAGYRLKSDEKVEGESGFFGGSSLSTRFWPPRLRATGFAVVGLVGPASAAGLMAAAGSSALMARR